MLSPLSSELEGKEGFNVVETRSNLQTFKEWDGRPACVLPRATASYGARVCILLERNLDIRKKIIQTKFLFIKY